MTTYISILPRELRDELKSTIQFVSKKTLLDELYSLNRLLTTDNQVLILHHIFLTLTEKQLMNQSYTHIKEIADFMLNNLIDYKSKNPIEYRQIIHNINHIMSTHNQFITKTEDDMRFEKNKKARRNILICKKLRKALKPTLITLVALYFVYRSFW